MEEILASIRRIIADDQEELRATSSSRFSEAQPFRSIREPAEREPVAPLIPLTVLESQDRGSAFEGSGDTVGEDILPLDLGAGNAFEIPGFDETSAPLTVAAEAQPFSEPVSYSPSSFERSAAPEDAHRPPSDEDALLSGGPDAAVAASLSKLGASVPSRNPQSMEDFVAGMLRPLLKDWLDENLPPLVERLVQAEIERISRGRR
ncbi:DUF2497 domain-containing protein [Microvirga rosea]|nr:DUF2497 domain-containing protein [Microvirga rosea]